MTDTLRGPAQPRHLRRAPITEAVIDFRVLPSAVVTIEALEAAAFSLERDYPKRMPLKTVEAKFNVGSGTVTPVRHADLGVIVKTTDEKSQAQFRLDGFTFNRLEPYTSWSEIYPETSRLWQTYTSVARPNSIVRLAARYINRLKLPLPITDLRDFLVEPPQVPAGLPQSLLGFLTRLVIRDGSEGQSAIVTQSLEANPTDPDRAMILLDIDAYKEVSLRITDQGEIDRVFNALHDFKNDIFFNSITQGASRLFE